MTIILEMLAKFHVEALLNLVPEAPGLQKWLERVYEGGHLDALFLSLKLYKKVGTDFNCGKLLPFHYR